MRSWTGNLPVAIATDDVPALLSFLALHPLPFALGLACSRGGFAIAQQRCGPLAAFLQRQEHIGAVTRRVSDRSAGKASSVGAPLVFALLPSLERMLRR